MANRHSHKKLRAAIKARMRATGASYQRARAMVGSGPVGSRPDPTRSVDLVSFTTLGAPMTLATFAGTADDLGAFALIIHAPRSATGRSLASWLPTMRFVRPRGTN